MVELGEARKRLGAYSWGVLEDAAVPGCFVEYFLETSWLQHLRHHERVSGADRKLREQILTLHTGDGKPVVRHLVGPKTWYLRGRNQIAGRLSSRSRGLLYRNE
jgi:hypothetical protein